MAGAGGLLARDPESLRLVTGYWSFPHAWYGRGGHIRTAERLLALPYRLFRYETRFLVYIVWTYPQTVYKLVTA
jgi:hypothetical protein